MPFQSILLRPNETRQFPIDLGQIVENLFFYQQTSIHLGRPQIIELVEKIDTDAIEALFKRPELNVFYNNSHAGVGIRSDEKHTEYFLTTFRHHKLDIEKQLFNAHFEATSDKTRAEDFAKRIAPLCKIYDIPRAFSDSINDEVRDATLMLKVLKAVLDTRFPEHGLVTEKIRFDVNFADDDVFTISSNLDYSKLGGQEFETSVLLHFVNALEDVYVIAEANSEISIPPINSIFVRLKINDALEKLQKSKKEIEVFNHFNYDNSVLLRETINSGEKSIVEFLPILDKAAKFKHWLQELPNDSNLLREYINKVNEKTWLEKLPAKAIRFYLVGAINTIINLTVPQPAGVIASTGLSAFNSFLLDKLSKQWKPNQFIEDELKAAVKKS